MARFLAGPPRLSHNGVGTISHQTHQEHSIQIREGSRFALGHAVEGHRHMVRDRRSVHPSVRQMRMPPTPRRKTTFLPTAILTSHQERVSSRARRPVGFHVVIGVCGGDSPGIRTRNQWIKS